LTPPDLPAPFKGPVTIKNVFYDAGSGFKIVVGKPEDGRKAEKFQGKIAFRTGDLVHVTALAKVTKEYENFH
jgi:hypothetical protein